METFNFFFHLCHDEKILTHTDNLSKTLQGKIVFTNEGQHACGYTDDIKKDAQ